MIKVTANDNRTEMEVAGTLSTLMSDLTHIIHALMGSIEKAYDDDDEKASARLLFKKLFAHGVMSGVFLKTDEESMKKLIDYIVKVDSLQERMSGMMEQINKATDSVQVGVCSLEELTKALKDALSDIHEPDDESPAEPEPEPNPMEEALAKAMNEPKPDEEEDKKAEDSDAAE